MAFCLVPFCCYAVALANPVSSSPAVQAPAQAAPAICPADLGTAIEAIISRPEFKRSQWGISIQTLDSNRILYALNADRYFIPASNAKLLTTAAALLKLGSQFRIRTPVYGTGAAPNLTTLRLPGRGDPSLTTERLQDLARQLRQKGVRHVSTVIVEDSYFAKTGINPTWEWEDLPFYYATSVNSLILNENAVTLKVSPQTVGKPLRLEWSDAIAAKQWQVINQTVTAPPGEPETVEFKGFLGQPRLEITGGLAADAEPDSFDLAILDPPSYFLEVFRQVLLEQGISSDHGLVVNAHQNLEGEAELATTEPDNLAMLIQKTNQDSNNLFAEALLQILASESSGQTGLEVVRQSLTDLGIAPDSYQLVDGSGLSRHNLVTPEALVQLLKLISQTNIAQVYRDSLSIAGQTGTLKKRFQNTIFVGNLQAKTGTLSGISGLSGYLNTPYYQPLVLSIILNNATQEAKQQRATIDQILLLLSQLKAC